MCLLVKIGFRVLFFFFSFQGNLLGTYSWLLHCPNFLGSVSDGSNVWRCGESLSKVFGTFVWTARNAHASGCLSCQQENL